MGMGFPWESDGKCPMVGGDGTARITFPTGPMS